MFKKDAVVYYSYRCKKCQRSIDFREGEEINDICPSCGNKMEGGNAIVTHPKDALENLKRTSTKTRSPQSTQPTQPKPVCCPKCGSTSIATTARGVDGFWGLIGASKTVNRCANCGYTWKPKKK